SIRTFDVADQRTRTTLETVTLLPRREALYDSASIEALLESLTPAEEEVLRSRTVSDPEAPGLEWLAPFLGQTQETLLDHLPENTLIITDGAGALRQDADDLMREDARLRERAATELPFLRRHPGFYRRPNLIFTNPSFTTVDILPFRGSDTTVVDFDCKEPPPISGNMDALATALSSYRTTDIAYLICADNPGQAERIRELVHDNFPGEDPPVIVALFQGGFFCPGARIALLTDHQIFKRQYRRRQRKRFKEGVALTSYTNLEPGDYVVHTEHGIARYLRLETLTLDKRHRDCLQLEYADSDKLYVPIEEFNRVSKYAGKEARPSLTQLGGAAWERAKQRAQKGIEELAERLVRLYAERKARPGHAFPPDTSWMRRLEASFPYEETEDQQKAIDAVKADMESSGAADRLICGDVGFGKTEVAVRAALKCVEDGRQVALLAPTTILAQQHYNTFSERLKDFPVRIDLMSRFRTAKELKATEQAVREGQVDILIGTHRLLNKKVEFQDLGVLVIDEEQRFGVKQKERLRELKTTVDTLTLSATPIPRTLQLSLSGARDMSLITTSPRGRLPITTAVTEFSPETIAQAILREIDRDGQVFFVHNRVQTIDAVRRYLKKLLPQIEILVGHGQMPERELERVMINFVNKKAQVLLCTAIIESGLDIPNVNTIIIDRADRFGMSQLYQLRGRVGRSTEQAYCYLLTPSYRRMTDDARKRLKAIEAHTELGSGFALAMRDLEIRGAGNLLGAKQSGYIDDIGFDMYTKLLEEAVAELKGEHLGRLIETTLELEEDAYLPSEYIDINQHKVDVYQRLAESRSLSHIARIREELRDRYGKLPEPAINLVEATALKLVAAQLNIDRVRLKSGRAELRFTASAALGRSQIEQLRQAVDQPLEFALGAVCAATIDLSALQAAERVGYIRRSLQQTWLACDPDAARAVPQTERAAPVGE
ncbi:MAG TPA: transcription-repair coupling factor, partial [candidate division Zixibacteria bacterium]|nr:transcription-repair coupling factor [candidate division Zixibacteria bacterium]